ncbi:MAG: glycosyltransferase family 2 protein [Gammaproteobacteria bacterium]
MYEAQPHEASGHAQPGTPDVTVVMVPRERFGGTPEAIDALLENTPTPFELIVVDNNSPASTRRYLRELAQRPHVRVLRTDSYVTPNQARNIGWRQARTPYIVFIDNDVAFAPGWLAKLIECAEQTGADVVGPLACQFEPLHEIIHCAGGQIMAPDELRRFLDTDDADLDDVPSFELDEMIFKQGASVADERARLHRAPTGFVEFHCCLVTRASLQRLGGLDEHMLSTKEHLDFCLALQRLGGTIYLEPQSLITYFSFAGERHLDWSEVPFYMLRWSDAWHEASMRHFRRKWNLADSPYFTAKRKIGSWRRSLAVARLLMQTFRLGGTRWPGRIARALVPLERVCNRLYTNARARRACNPRIHEVQASGRSDASGRSAAAA